MTNLINGAPTRIRHIFHPTDFSAASMAAFGHALKLTHRLQSDLTIMHVDPARADPDFEDFPRVRETLSRWGILKERATKDDLLALGIGVRKIRGMADQPVTSILQLLSWKPADLMVLATYPKAARSQWWSEESGEPLARKSRTMTLFVPGESPGFVSLHNGVVALQRFLIPMDHRPDAQAAVDAACAIASSLGIDTAIFELLYVGEPADVPRPRLQRRDGWIWKQSVSTGIVVEEILEAAERQQPDLIVMATEWRTGFLDALRGSTTERILRRTICALLAVPVYEPLA